MKKTLISIALSMGVLTVSPSVLAQAAEGSETAYENQPVMSYRSPDCGCCGSWEDHMRENGFEVQSMKTDEMAEIKSSLGIPEDSLSCHTAMVGDYFVEGHVPAEIVKALLESKPNIRGVSAPGMPMGSPGMEVPGAPTKPYVIHSIDLDGNASVLTTVQP